METLREHLAAVGPEYQAAVLHILHEIVGLLDTPAISRNLPLRGRIAQIIAELPEDLEEAYEALGQASLPCVSGGSLDAPRQIDGQEVGTVPVEPVKRKARHGVD